MDPTSPDFWSALGAIVVANLLLSGDNAVVIALAAQRLPATQRRRAIVFGSALAIVARIGLTLVAARLLALPVLKLAGGLALAWIGIDLARGGGDGAEAPSADAAMPATPFAAIRAIVVADLVMSLDNVLAVAAAARGDLRLLVIGLALSIPLIVVGSALLASAMARLRWLAIAGAALIGWLAGQLVASDSVWHRDGGAEARSIDLLCGVAGALAVLALASWTTARRRRSAPRHEAT